MKKKDELIITYYPSDNCNFSCDYCYRIPKRNGYTATIQDIDNLIKNISKNKIKYFKILGGEPLVFPHIEYLLERLSSSNNIQIIKCFTNGFLTDKLIYLAKKYPNVRFSYSIHPALTNLDENIIQKILLPNIKYNLVCDFRYTDKLNYYINLLQKYNLEFMMVNIVIDKQQNNEYSSIENFNNLYKLCFKEDKPNINYKGMYCYNDIIVIAPNGTFQYGECHYSINKFNYSIYDKPYIHIPRKIICSMQTSCTSRCIFTYKEPR